MLKHSPRRHAQLNNLPHYHGKICRHCDKDRRYTSNGACVTCTQRQAANKRMRERNALINSTALPVKNRGARTKAAAKGQATYKGRSCPMCDTRLRHLDTGKCVKCQSEGVTYYSRKTPSALDPALRLFRSAQSRAKQFGREFNLEISDIIIPDTCPVLGSPMKSPSLDRKNNDLGYIKGNVRVISRRANVLKNDGTAAEFEAILRYMRGP